MTEAATTQEFWAGEFGNAYTDRNRVEVKERVEFWRAIIESIMPGSVLEIGCNAGWNLDAIKLVAPHAIRLGLDINLKALDQAKLKGHDVGVCAAGNVANRFSNFDLVFTAGLLIHISPKDIGAVVSDLLDASARYVLVIEYVSESGEEEEIDYRGHSGKLWKRAYEPLFEERGATLVDKGWAGAGFDRCVYHLFDKNTDAVRA